MNRQIKKVGGSLALMIPRDVAEAMSLTQGSPVSLSLVGRQLVVEPQDDVATPAEFRRAFAAVLRKHGPAFKALADFDAGKE